VKYLDNSFNQLPDRSSLDGDGRAVWPSVDIPRGCCGRSVLLPSGNARTVRGASDEFVENGRFAGALSGDRVVRGRFYLTLL